MVVVFLSDILHIEWYNMAYFLSFLIIPILWNLFWAFTPLFPVGSGSSVQNKVGCKKTGIFTEFQWFEDPIFCWEFMFV